MATTNNQTMLPTPDRWKRAGMLPTPDRWKRAGMLGTAGQTSGATTSTPGATASGSTATSGSASSGQTTTTTTTAPKTTTATQAASPIVKAETELWQVDPNQLTSNNLTKLISDGSPYLDLARTGAAQTANSRGLLNSSMAAGAGEAAAIASALPIAQSDANLYADVAKTNTGAKNQGNLFNAGEQNKFVMQKDQQVFTAGENKLDRAQQMAIADKNIAAQQALLKAQQAFAGSQAELDRAQQLVMADKSLAAQQTLMQAQQNFAATQSELDRAQQTAMQTGQQDWNATQNALDRTNRENLVRLQASLTQAALPQTFAANLAGTALQGINGIMADPNMTPETKQGAVTNLITAANSTMQWGATFYNTPLPAIQAPGSVTPTATAAPAASTPAPYVPINPNTGLPYTGYEAAG